MQQDTSTVLAKPMPVLEIKRLGPLSDTEVSIHPLTLLTGPPGQGKTYILNAIFSELLSTDLALIGACFFRGRWGDKLRVVEALYREKVIEIIFKNIKYSKGKLEIGEFQLCVHPNRAQRKLERCVEGWLYPRNSRFKLNINKKKGNNKIITMVSRAMKLALLKSGFAKVGDKLCIGDRNIEVPYGALKDIGFSFEKIYSIIDIFQDINGDYVNWVLASIILDSKIVKRNKKLYKLRASLEKAEKEIRTVHESFAEYRPVYAWMGRGLVAMAAVEPSIGGAVEFSGITGMGLTAFLPVYGMIKNIRMGLSLMSSPEAPRELGLLLDIVKPIVMHDIRVAKNRLVIDVGGVAVPFRLAHGSALSIVGLLLSAGSLIKNGRGYLLIDEAEHLLHPSAQAIMGVLLLGLAGVGLHVIATTHSTAITTVISKIAETASKNGKKAVIEEVSELYRYLGFRPPSREALSLVAEGAKRNPVIYVVDSGKIRMLTNPLEWVEKLSDAWLGIASWAGRTSE